jgi:hypothetical protein
MLLLGVLAAQAEAAPAAAGSYDLLETEILASTQASITFTSGGVWADYQHLQIRWVTARVGSADTGNIKVALNSDTTDGNYYYHRLYGNGSTVTSGAVNNRRLCAIGGSGDEYSAGVSDFLDFGSSNKRTTIRTLGGRTAVEPFVSLWSVLWNNTNAVTSIQLAGDGFNLEAGSRFSLYGLKGA